MIEILGDLNKILEWSARRKKEKILCVWCKEREWSMEIKHERVCQKCMDLRILKERAEFYAGAERT